MHRQQWKIPKIRTTLRNKGINHMILKLVMKTNAGLRNSFMNRDAQNQECQMHLTWPLEYQFIRTCRAEADDDFNILTQGLFAEF